MKLGERLFELRRKAGLTQEELSEKLGVSRQAVGKWENGTSVPELEKLLTLSELYGMPIGELLGVEPPAGEGQAAESQEAAGLEQNGPAPDMGPLEELLREVDRRQRAGEELARRRQRRVWCAMGAAVAVLVVVTAVLWYKISGLHRQISGVNSLVVFTQNSLSQSIEGMRNSIAGILREQGSLFLDCSCETVDYEKQTGLLTVALRASPKSLSGVSGGGFTLAGDEGEYECAAELRGGALVGEIQVPPGTYTFIAAIDGGEGLTREELGRITVSTSDLMAEVGVKWVIGPVSQEGGWSVSGILALMPEGENPLVSACLTVAVDGVEVSRTPLDLDDGANWYGEYRLPQEYLDMQVTVESESGVTAVLSRPVAISGTGSKIFALPLTLSPFDAPEGSDVTYTLTAEDTRGIEYSCSLLSATVSESSPPYPLDVYRKLYVVT